MPSLRRLIDSPRHEVVAVLTRPDAPAGRGRQLRPSPVREVAEAAGVPVLTPATLRDPDVVRALAQLTPQCCPVVAYGQLVPRAALDVPEHGWVNLHFSLLPSWRGAAPVQHALLAGDDVTGASTFLLDDGLDTGPVLGTLVEPIRPGDTAGALLERLADSGARLLEATLDGLEDGRLVAVPQPADGVSLAPKLSAADARIDWTAPALRVDRLIRATTPAPGAWSTLHSERVKLGPVQPLPGAAAAPRDPAGSIRLDGARVTVATGTDPVALSWVQPAGRGPMPAVDWQRGARLAPGDAFR